MVGPKLIVSPCPIDIVLDAAFERPREFVMPVVFVVVLPAPRDVPDVWPRDTPRPSESDSERPVFVVLPVPAECPMPVDCVVPTECPMD